MSADPLFPVRVRVIDTQGQEIGTQDHGLPLSELTPHLVDEAALSAFARDDLVPRLVQRTLGAMTAQVPPDRAEALLALVGSVEVVLGPDTPHSVAWTVVFGTPSPAAGEA